MNFQTVTFAEYPKFTFITDQYAGLGVMFVDGDDNIELSSSAFPPDNFGLDGNTAITMEFTSPQFWIGVDYPGVIALFLYDGDALVYASSTFDDGGTPGVFAGLISDQPFDRVVLDNTFPEVNIGDLYFGPPIPAPGALVVLAAAVVSPICRRRGR